MSHSRASSRREHRKPFYARFWFWLPVVLVLAIVAVAVWAALLAPRVLTVRDTLSQAMPLATQAKQQLLEGDSAGASQTTAELAEMSAEARKQSDTFLWKGAEWVPVAGPNLQAVRVASESVDSLVADVVAPVSQLDIASLKQAGGVNLAALAEAQQVVDGAAAATDRITEQLQGLNRGALVSQVDDGVSKLDGAVAELRSVLDPARTALSVMLPALGAEGERSYLLLFQNNAESRGTGGNPAAIMRITFDEGRVSIAEQASSADFKNGRPSPIVPLDEPTVALFDDKIGRYVQDITLTPDFAETSRIAQAFWAESFGTPVDGVISMDPVALSYLLSATGPIPLPTGEALTGENAVPLLLSEVYSKFPDPEEQDDFFASVAGLVFDAVVSGGADMRALLDPLTRSVDEGRLIFSPNDEALGELIAGTKLAGELPGDNSDQTTAMVLVNDITEGKLDYYMQLDVNASSTQCTAPDAPEFTVTTNLANTLNAEQAAALPAYVSPARFFAKGSVSTDLIVYGPVGSAFDSISVDGAQATVKAQTEHLGRPAVRINVENAPGVSHQIVAKFTGAQGEYGPLEVRHTPMVRPSNVAVETPGCE